ncbi:T9SS type A sorting domain-containing protein [Flavobacterium sp.]|uniref:T9SS type A sorting domain-containing protein n=1 Tax=Flavobacterium sp. TaxID=239 RepID=UPI002FDB58FF
MKIITLKFLPYLAILMPFLLFAQGKSTEGRKVFGKTIQSVNPVTGHVRCASTEYEAYLQEKHPDRANTEAFENWIAPKIQEIKRQREQGRNVNNVITIPVVVHVIHSGQAVGTGRNISDTRVQSQITVLNQDFRRMMGTPGFNSDPVGADVEIEFCLARTNPDGGVTTGINRVNLGGTIWGYNNVETLLKPQTQWDPNRYFNIWVCEFGGDLDGVLGFAQFPDASGLGGINAIGGPAQTDGVIIDWRCFGTSTLAPGSYFTDLDKGRTTTHEIGHCFGLRHIWGDNSSCTVNATDSFQDYCPDTPAASTEHYFCQIGSDSCPSAPGLDMVNNYMDYSDDYCMNIFTQDQKTRMRAVALNSPRRVGLNANVCNVGQSYQFNGRLRVNSLNLLSCSTIFTPSLTLTNTGTVTMTSAVITYNINGGTNQTYNWSGSLAVNGTANFSLPNLTAASGDNVFNISITSINGNPDQYSPNDASSIAFKTTSNFVATQITIQLQRDRYGSETTWNLTNLTTGAIVASGGPYSNSGSLPALITQNVTAGTNTCYAFTINDTEGDGICCDWGLGYYRLLTNSGQIIAEGGEFGTTETVTFSTNLLSVGSNEAFGTVVLYPNPTSGLLNVHISNQIETPTTYTVYNMLGQVISTKKITSTEISLDTSNFSNGVYFIKLSNDNYSKTLEFIKN